MFCFEPRFFLHSRVAAVVTTFTPASRRGFCCSCGGGICFSGACRTSCRCCALCACFCVPQRMSRTLSFWGSMGRVLFKYYVQERNPSATEQQWTVRGRRTSNSSSGSMCSGSICTNSSSRSVVPQQAVRSRICGSRVAVVATVEIVAPPLPPKVYCRCNSRSVLSPRS